jgi:hypothetical protein
MERDETAKGELVDLGTVSLETKGDFPFAPETGVGREPMGLSDD